jgi:hypothetical protein
MYGLWLASACSRDDLDSATLPMDQDLRIQRNQNVI